MMEGLRQYIIQILKSIIVWLYKPNYCDKITLVLFILAIVNNNRIIFLLAIFFLSLSFLINAINNCARAIQRKKIEVNIIIKKEGTELNSTNSNVRIFEVSRKNEKKEE